MPLLSVLIRQLRSGIYRNPIFHQVVFAILMLMLVYRVETLIRHPNEGQSVLPPEKIVEIRKVLGFGSITFITGFIIWHLDNIFYTNITRWKLALGWPAAFLPRGVAKKIFIYRVLKLFSLLSRTDSLPIWVYFIYFDLCAYQNGSCSYFLRVFLLPDASNSQDSHTKLYSTSENPRHER